MTWAGQQLRWRTRHCLLVMSVAFLSLMVVLETLQSQYSAFSRRMRIQPRHPRDLLLLHAEIEGSSTGFRAQTADSSVGYTKYQLYGDSRDSSRSSRKKRKTRVWRNAIRYVNKGDENSTGEKAKDHSSSDSMSEGMYYQLNKNKVSPYKFKTVIGTNSKPCQERSDQKHVLVIAAVLSAPQNVHERNAIRNTWGGFTQNLTLNGTQINMRTLFFMGLSLDRFVNEGVVRESQENHDIIVDDFVDSYQNLSLKSVMLLHWVKTKCSRANTYVIKTDDDMLVHPELLMAAIAEQPRTGALFGARVGGNRVSRVGRWAISAQQYPFSVLPQYLAGNLYVMSCDVAVQLFVTSEHFQRIDVEDVYVTGILPRLAGVRSYGLPGFPIWLTSGPLKLCEFLQGHWVAVHRVSMSHLFTFWDKLSIGATCR